VTSSNLPKVLVVAAHPVGGIRNWMRYCYRDPKFRSYDITVVTPEYELISVLRDDLCDAGVRVETVGTGTRQFAVQLQKRLLFGRFDLVHSHGFTAASLVALGRWVRRAPHLVSVHDVLLANQFADLAGRTRRAWISTALASATVVHTVGPAATVNLLANFPRLRRPGRVECVPNGIDSPAFLKAQKVDLRARYKLSERDFLIGFFGRFMSQKGFRYLTEAVRQIKNGDQEPAMRPVIIAVGNGGFRSAEERQVAALGLQDNVIFEDFVAEPAPMMKSVDVLAMPSLWEASSLVAMEAMAAGTPLICSDDESLVESAKGTPAVVVPRANGSALANALRAAIDDRAATASFARQAEAYAPIAARRFDSAITSAGVAALYDRLIRSR
jgi:glycosyltransferase involved in cell wall biosynthesis